ncbi:uncharacterized protein LOC131596802 [Vicia villosa]|uniref:uncharacterized protein LOC131596802 n=1 Tax=Vicia villosa TaxID=3911 RepID=UPI00273CDC98|nr:uncharacterized protein LOC131596802 [Vicia villosa]
MAKWYDGASNMQGKFGGLGTLIQNENSSAYYVHCFAHQLQLAIVACAKIHKDVSGFSGGQIETGSGLNRELYIARAGDTRWGSHSITLTSLMTLYGVIIGILGFINNLSAMLQKRDQDLLNALLLVNAIKQELQEIRNDGWEELISKVMKICNKHDIDVPDMDAPYVQGKKPRRHVIISSVSNLHHYKHDCLFSFLDLQLHELNVRFVDVPEVMV